ncbi:AraC family transcriptional regulator [Companilactobacillus sp. HBUAS56275]|uniref:AraC family transcriptional regulator n=1 Tax=Candidatus Companilactobacillus pullicola TaxID=2838523 RepID=A0A9D1ZLW1_9LACO|nr:AraC family transcriptional regulator [Candidatus Companilactobacillus pullicola]
MAIYLEMPKIDPKLGFKFIKNRGDILTTPHWHREYELILLTKGKLNLGINDKQYQLKNNGIAFFKSGDIHYIVATPDSNRFVYQFDMNLFNESMIKDSDLLTKLNAVSQVSTLWDDSIEKEMNDILLKIVEEEDNSQSDMDFIIISLMYHLISIMVRQLPTTKDVKDIDVNLKSKEILETLNKVFTYVESNYQYHISLQDVAEKAGFSPYYFSRFFKKNVGQTFIEFLNNYRIDKSKWEIINTDASISEVLAKSGFSSNKTFYRNFRSQVGMSPNQYRKKYSLIE